MVNIRTQYRPNFLLWITSALITAPVTVEFFCNICHTIVCSINHSNRRTQSLVQCYSLNAVSLSVVVRDSILIYLPNMNLILSKSLFHHLNQYQHHFCPHKLIFFSISSSLLVSSPHLFSHRSVLLPKYSCSLPFFPSLCGAPPTPISLPHSSISALFFLPYLLPSLSASLAHLPAPSQTPQSVSAWLSR